MIHNFQGDLSMEPGINYTGCNMYSHEKPTKAGLTFNTGREVEGASDDLLRTRQDGLPRMELIPVEVDEVHVFPRLILPNIYDSVRDRDCELVT